MVQKVRSRSRRHIVTNNDKPRIRAQRGTNGASVTKSTKASAGFQLEYVNDSLQLNGPTNSRRGALSQYTKDILVYAGALEKEVLDLRDQKVKLNEKITELNGTVTELEQQIVTNNDKHQRELAIAKSATRTANATLSAERARADMSEALDIMRQEIHNLFDGAPIGDLSTSRGTTDGAPVRAAFYSCGGLRFAHSVSSHGRSLSAWSALDNPIKLKDCTVTRFAGDRLLISDKTHLLFLREAATVEGYERNKKRLSEKEMDQLYDMERTNRTFGCGHNVIQHIQMREELSLRFAPAIVTVVFERLESSGSTNSHSIELTRAIMIAAGMSENVANEVARRQAQQGAQLDEGYDPALTRALGATALSGTIEFDEALDLRPEDLRHKPKVSDRLQFIKEHDGPLHNDPLGLYGIIQPRITEVGSKFGVKHLQGSFGSDPYGENFQLFAEGPTHDLGTDNLFTPGRPAQTKTPKHTELCKARGHDVWCVHPDHRPNG